MQASVLVYGITLALATASAHADNKREQNVGVVSGAAVGALAGGPVGILIGAALGAVIGDKVGDGQALPAVAQERDAALDDLERVRFELSSTRATLAHTEGRVRVLEQSVAERDDALAALSEARAPELGRGLAIDVLFRTGESALQTDVEQRLAEVAAVLATSPALRVQLDGHADPRGDEEYNRTLSDARVQAVRRILVAGGVDASRIEALAHGESDSHARDGDLDAYALERLVRISVGVAPVTEDTQATTVADSH
jgi:outer membrane protein OmpA-like peptidoglycan-associated protein